MSGRGYICSGLKSQGPPGGVGWKTEPEESPETKTDACMVCRGVGLVGEEHICSGLIESRTTWGSRLEDRARGRSRDENRRVQGMQRRRSCLEGRYGCSGLSNQGKLGKSAEMP